MNALLTIFTLCGQPMIVTVGMIEQDAPVLVEIPYRWLQPAEKVVVDLARERGLAIVSERIDAECV